MGRNNPCPHENWSKRGMRGHDTKCAHAWLLIYSALALYDFNFSWKVTGACAHDQPLSISKYSGTSDSESGQPLNKGKLYSEAGAETS